MSVRASPDADSHQEKKRTAAPLLSLAGVRESPASPWATVASAETRCKTSDRLHLARSCWGAAAVTDIQNLIQNGLWISCGKPRFGLVAGDYWGVYRRPLPLPEVARRRQRY